MTHYSYSELQSRVIKHTKTWINTENCFGCFISVWWSDWHVSIPTALNTLHISNEYKFSLLLVEAKEFLDWSHSKPNLTQILPPQSLSISNKKSSSFSQEKILKGTERHLQATYTSHRTNWEPRKKYTLERGRERGTLLKLP